MDILLGFRSNAITPGGPRLLHQRFTDARGYPDLPGIPVSKLLDMPSWKHSLKPDIATNRFPKELTR